MRYYALLSSDGDSKLAVEADEGVLIDLTSIDQELVEIDDLALAASLSGLNIDTLTLRLLEEDIEPDTYDLSQIMDDSRSGDGDVMLDRPFEPPEVWAAGVTYKTSEMERMRESDTPDVYSSVYTAERPELFLKATPDRCVGPFESVGVRRDSTWSVPEPELAFVLYRGEIIGYTIGNDMSSRSIEGENPLYLPQAKMFDRCCSIGPCFVTANYLEDPYNLTISCTISREGEVIFNETTSTSLMARKCEELADWLQRSNFVPNMTTVMTGTAIVPPPELSLEEGDVVTIEIEGIGVLENDVVVV